MRKRVLLGVVILSVCAVGAGAAFVQKATQRVVGDYFDSNGVRIHYTDEGEGTPVILIHGFAANADLNWRSPGVTEELAKDYRVISIDNRGHGLSEKPLDPKKYGREMVDDVVRLMDHLQITKAHIIGYSMGGFITLKLLTEYPERVLTASPCGMAWKPLDEENTSFLTKLADSIEKGGTFRPLFERLTPIGEEISEVRIAAVDYLVGYFNDKMALANLIRSFTEFEVREDVLKRNAVPTLTCVGDIDPLRDGAEKMHELMPSHELVFIEGADHLTTMDNPDYIHALKDFLKKHESPQVVPALKAA